MWIFIDFCYWFKKKICNSKNLQNNINHKLQNRCVEYFIIILLVIIHFDQSRQISWIKTMFTYSMKQFKCSISKQRVMVPITKFYRVAIYFKYTPLDDHPGMAHIKIISDTIIASLLRYTTKYNNFVLYIMWFILLLLFTLNFPSTIDFHFTALNKLFIPG